MNALFALAFWASSSWAGVVMPVESGVAPAGPSVSGVPVLAPGGASLGAPSWSSSLDLRGALPLLPAPVPGLVGPALRFTAGVPEAAAARPEAAAAAASPVPSPAKAARTRAADGNPALPGKPSPGASAPALALDRKGAASRLDGAASKALLESSTLERARPEQAAGLGRVFFDQGAEKRGTIAEPEGRGSAPAPSRSAPAGTDEAAGTPPGAGSVEGAVVRRGRGLSPRGAGSALGAGHVPAPNAFEDAAREETLHDAVAGAPAGAGAGGAVFFRSAAPNGELAASAGGARLPALGAPHPLSLDLSGSGLIVRVRAALDGAAASSPAAALPSARPLPAGPSTALLERGAMLEAFAVAADYAARSAARAVPAPEFSAGSRAPARNVPAPQPLAPPLWWAWFALPLFVAAVRGLV